MRRRPQDLDKPAIILPTNGGDYHRDIGIVLSGGGSRAAYQIGALKALSNSLQNDKATIKIILGSSIGAVNGLVLAAGLRLGLNQALEELENIWIERTFRNSFSGSPSMTFFRSIKMAVLKYAKDPTPGASKDSIFDPTPLMNRLQGAIDKFGGLSLDSRAEQLRAVGVMTTIEGKERKPLLFLSAKERMNKEMLAGAFFRVHHVDNLTIKHGFASAALPTVLPPVELDIEEGKVSLVDGGISNNVPVDPAVRLGADRVVVVDISGRDWWHNHFGEPHDKRPEWEVPAGLETFCFRPPETFVARCKTPLGPVLKEAVGGSTRDFISALGPTWPIFQLIKKRLGEAVAYEVMSYGALHPTYARALIERGYNETIATLRNQTEIQFIALRDYCKWYSPVDKLEEALTAQRPPAR